MATLPLTICDYTKATTGQQVEAPNRAVRVSLGDHERKMDLSAAAFAELEALMTPWLELGEKVRSDYKLVRAYFLEVHGETLKGNGAISKDNLTKYDAWVASIGAEAFKAWSEPKKKAEAKKPEAQSNETQQLPFSG